MTIIAYKNGVMAADTLAANGSVAVGSTIKIARNQSGDLMGAAGTAQWAGQMLGWFRDGESGKHPTYVDKEGSYGTAFIVRALDDSKGAEFFWGDIASEPCLTRLGPSEGFAVVSVVT